MVTKTFTFDGVRYYVRGKSDREVYEKMARKKLELENGKVRITKNTLVKDWVSEWLQTYKFPAVSDAWGETVETICRSVIVSEIGNQRLRDVKPLHLQKILNGKSDMSKAYLRVIYGIMKDIFRTAKANQLLHENPAENLSLPAGKKAKARRSITEKERFYILKTCETHRAGLFYKIMLYCGLRPGEVAALQWRNIDLKDRVLTVDSAVDPKGRVGSTKTEAGFRRVPIPAILADELRNVEHESPFDYVCTNASGYRLTKDSMRQQWNSFKHQLNIEMGCRVFRNELVPPYPVADDLVPYCLRHTYCTDLQAAGVPINVAKELMGHSNISITAKIYTHASKESFEDATAAIDALQKRREKSATVSATSEVLQSVVL